MLCSIVGKMLGETTEVRPYAVVESSHATELD